MMKLLYCCSFLSVVLLAECAVIGVNQTEEELPISNKGKSGRCPLKLMDKSLCADDVTDQCSADSDCHGNGKCCSTGCAKVCVQPMSTSCELSRENTIRRGRSLGIDENKLVLPECGIEGTFAPIQCLDGICYCVNTATGFELPGTRARSLETVNCSDPSPCAGYQCRMLCPFDFDLDEEGCPLCQCRDPCRDIKCPSGNACVMEEIECSNEPCPPLPTCKQPRSLSSLCPFGDPLMIDESAQRPFLCGTDPGKPNCPALYKCQVNRGHDYGVCCANMDELIKPGACPADGHNRRKVEDGGQSNEDPEVRCGVNCDHDLQCPSTQKCCMSAVCGQHCVQPTNLTACLQQRMIAELLIVSEHAGKGYIPQCRESNGLFLPRQCSRNGLVCWCVDSNGRKKPRTVGAALEVTCDPDKTAVERSGDCPSEEQCPTICEFGYSVDDYGCTSCECEEPCNQLVCPAGSECIMREDPSCSQLTSCPGLPMCVSNDSTPLSPSATVPVSNHITQLGTPTMSSFKTNITTKCPLGDDPLSVGGLIAVCTPTNPCPHGYICTSPPEDSIENPVCCSHNDFLGSNTKAGQCPFIPYGDKEICSPDNQCQGDMECPDDSKCCVVADCGGRVCVEAVPAQNFSLGSDILESPTMCEYLRDLVQLEGVSLALPVPMCDKNGAYEPVQCNALGQCWCVDDFGSPIPRTKASNRELVNCDRLQVTSSCNEVTCRLGCDYGFVLDPETACPICECRNPCNHVDCGVLHECQLVDVPCIDGICPPIPQCVPSLQRKENTLTCPEGNPYAISDKNVTMTCSPRARALECPIGYSCYSDENSIDGICCPAPASSEKAGQCPYLMPKESGSCDLECSEDAHCQGDEKCCSNGCGTHCLPSVSMTACQHQRALLEYRAREAGIPSDKVFLPECDFEGSFIPGQCHPGTLTCWCVDTQGIEVAGTRVSSPTKPNCQKPLICPAMNCNLACLHGYQLNSSGCPICACRDPCEEVTCSSTSEECRIVHVACVGEPCPPLPVCLPKLENPCPTGSPLTVNDTMVECGPQGQSCPSSHKCHLSPLGEYALCCPKPREACYHDREAGVCEGSIQRWYFNADKNRCEKFRYGGCGGNLNNFESEEECASSCPPLTSCQRIRRKNLIFSEKDKKITFLPKCDKLTGSWLPEQCLEELGVCWCVTSNGDQKPGTLTRGAPTCQENSRTARLLNFDFDPDKPANMICEPGETVHMCDRSICENKVCLSHPGAVCRVDPCGGCSFRFVDAFNAPVDCEVGLTDCQKQLQNVLNSPAFERPNRILADVPSQTKTNFDIDVDPAYPQSVEDDVPVAGVNIFDRDQPRYRRDTVDKNTNIESPIAEAHLVDPTDSDIVDKQLRVPFPYQDANSDFNVDPEPPSKPGTCPTLMKDFSLLQCNPTRDCSIDAECPGDSKCCFTGCGTICLQPKESPLALGMTLEAPQCHSDGSWAREQRSGDITWCVDSKGRPLHETLTRGHVRCGPNGQILEQMSLGNVCPKAVRPMVCTDECEHAVCSTHPDAVCVADPCNQCQVSFYSATGEQINCEEKCSQPVSAGMCRASFKRYFYNSSANVCQEFIYGGCQGNENNFPTIEMCQAECGEKALTCDQPVRVGHCSDGEARWYYNKNSRKCELFLYSGCGGNDNNFPTKEACENTCPDMILCPYWSVSSMEPDPCSRFSACRNQTCHGYPDTICKVDPCTCTAHFYNLDGERVSCMMPTESPKTRLSFTFEEESSSTSSNIISKTIQNDKKGPITIFLEGEPTLSRCELLQRHLRQSNSRRYVAQCDESGRFIPTQCYSSPFIESFIPEEIEDGNDIELRRVETPNCWCVDEIGRKTQPTVYFRKGERACDVVSVESVVVTLGFRRGESRMNKLDKTNEQEIKKQVRMLLKQLSAETLEDNINIINLPELTQVKFTLLGNNKVDVAYQLEDQVRRGGLALRLKDDIIPADLRASWFHHQVSEPRWTAADSLSSASRDEDPRPAPREVVSEAVVLAPPYLAATIVFTVISAILVCALVVSVVLYRRHITGQYPKAPRGSLQSLTFSDTSLDRRSIGSRYSDTNNSRRFSLGGATPPPPSNRRQQNITTIEEEYRAAIH